HDGTALASSGMDGRLRVWERASKEAEYIPLDAGDSTAYLHGYLKGDRSALFYVYGKRWEVRQVDAHPSTPPLFFDAQATAPLSVDGGRLSVATAAGLLSVWDTSTSVPRVLSTTTLAPAEAHAPDVTLSPSARFATVQLSSGTVYLVAISARGEVTWRTIDNM